MYAFKKKSLIVVVVGMFAEGPHAASANGKQAGLLSQTHSHCTEHNCLVYLWNQSCSKSKEVGRKRSYAEQGEATVSHKQKNLIFRGNVKNLQATESDNSAVRQEETSSNVTAYWPLLYTHYMGGLTAW